MNTPEFRERLALWLLWITPALWSVNYIVARIAPGVVSTLRLPWEGDGPLVDLRQPPGVAFHVYDAAGQLTTHYRVVP